MTGSISCDRCGSEEDVEVEMRGNGAQDPIIFRECPDCRECADFREDTDCPRCAVIELTVEEAIRWAEQHDDEVKELCIACETVLRHGRHERHL